MSGVNLGPTTVPPNLDELDHEQRVETMVAWFHDNFEDPAVITPYESAEGGYQWIWGGPYDPSEELYDAFSGATDEDIEAAAEEIASDGLFDWAPNHSRLVDEPEGEEEANRLEERLEQLRGDLNQLEAAIAHLRNPASMIGHNQPPEDMRIGLDERDLNEALESIGAIRTELDRPTPAIEANVSILEQARAHFALIALKVMGWAKAAGKWIVGGVLSGVGKELWEDPVALYHKIESICSTLGAWAHALYGLF